MRADGAAHDQSVVNYLTTKNKGKVVKEDIIKGKWNELKGEAKKKWGKLTDDDLMITAGHKGKMVGVLQKKYGYEKEKAEEEY